MQTYPQAKSNWVTLIPESRFRTSRERGSLERQRPSLHRGAPNPILVMRAGEKIDVFQQLLTSLLTAHATLYETFSLVLWCSQRLHRGEPSVLLTRPAACGRE